MSIDARPNRSTEVRRRLGLGRPRHGGWRWLRDPHFVLAALAALPVWAALPAVAGGGMHLDFAPAPLVSLVLVQPVVEEIAFRGVLQGYLLDRACNRRLGPVSYANAGTTAAFVALHLLAQPPLWALAVAVPSLVFGHVRERLGSVLPAVALHAFYNAGFALTVFWAQGGR